MIRVARPNSRSNLFVSLSHIFLKKRSNGSYFVDLNFSLASLSKVWECFLSGGAAGGAADGPALRLRGG